MEVRPGYKQTEVGVIPEEWAVCHLSSLVASGPKSGYSGRSGKDARGTPTLSLAATSSGRIILDEETVKHLEETLDQYSDIFLKSGDVLVQRSNTPDLVGTTAIFNGPSGVYAYPDLMMRLRFKTLEAAHWFWRYANSSGGRRYFISVAAGSTGTMPKISGEKLRNMPLPLPEPPEQGAIATALSDVDALLEGLDQLIAKKRNLKQATMQRLLTGQIRLPGFGGNKGAFTQTDIGILPDDWEVERVRSLAVITTGSRNTQDRIEDGAYPFFVRSATVERINTYSYDGEAVLTAGDGVGTGKVFHYVNGRFDIHQRVYMISNFNERLNGGFFFLVFSTRFFNRIMSMTAKSSVDSVRMEMIADMRIPLPSAEEQIAIAAVLSDMDAEVAALESRRDKIRALRQGMMQELLTGRTRLIESCTQTSEQPTPQTEGPQANIHFRRSVLAAEIIDRLHEESTFGHVKFEKMMFLVEHLCAVDTGSTYLRKAAGPYDNRALRSIDSQLRKQQWFDCRKVGERYRYTPMENRGGHKGYFARYFSGISDSFEKIMQTFKTLETERCEIVATLLAAWSDLLQAEGAVSDERIVHEVLNNWHESKRRISEDRWLKALGWMRSQGFVPKEGV